MAVASQVDYLVSGDKRDVLTLKWKNGVCGQRAIFVNIATIGISGNFGDSLHNCGLILGTISVIVISTIR